MEEQKTHSHHSTTTFLSNDLSYQIWLKKYRVNDETFDEWLERVSDHNQELKELISQSKFLFGGRILANINTNRGSLSNCYSSGYVEDNLKDIMRVNTDLALTYQKQGGQGLSLSKIRPKGTKVGTDFISDGIIPFMEIYNKTTESISQGAGRRGALLISLNINHLEAEDFITIKSDHKKINNANLSVEIDDDFMELVNHYYQTGETLNKIITQTYDSETITYSIVPIKLYKLLCEQACKHAEPGVIFTNRFRNYNLMQYDNDYNIETCNPCGEQPLKAGAACLLGAINLSEYVENPFTDAVYFNYEQLLKDLRIYYKALDDLVSKGLNLHALPIQQKTAEAYRNIGLGTMGWADMFIKFEYFYGDDNSQKLTEEISKFLAKAALLENMKLGYQLGSFPAMKHLPIYSESDFVKNLFPDDCIDIKYLRNCSMLTVAPTGSISSMLNVSSGIEPNFRLKYKRKTIAINGTETVYDVESGIVNQYREITNNYGKLPDYFISSESIDWKQRIDIQAIVQNYTDSGISSTINLPKGTKPQDVEQIYLYAWKKGLKGITIYVDGSRDAILFTEETKLQKYESNVIKRPKELEAELYVTRVKLETFVVIVGLLEGKPYEVFAYKVMEEDALPESSFITGKIVKIKSGMYQFVSKELTISSLELRMEAIEERATTILSSMLLRHNVDIEQITRTLKKVNPIISSFTSAVCRILNKYIKEYKTVSICPNCGSELIHKDGCTQCSACEYSKCMLIYKERK